MGPLTGARPASAYCVGMLFDSKAANYACMWLWLLIFAAPFLVALVIGSGQVALVGMAFSWLSLAMAGRFWLNALDADRGRSRASRDLQALARELAR